MYQISLEQAGDGPEIETLLDQSFGPARRQRTAYCLRQDVPALAELCFVLRGARLLCASIRFWPIMIAGRHPALLLGPLAVGQAWRGRSLGKTLIRHSLTRARVLGHEAVLLIGDADYYRPFWFFHGFDRQFIPAQASRARPLSGLRIAAWRLGRPVRPGWPGTARPVCGRVAQSGRAVTGPEAARSHGRYRRDTARDCPPRAGQWQGIARSDRREGCGNCACGHPGRQHRNRRWPLPPCPQLRALYQRILMISS